MLDTEAPEFTLSNLPEEFTNKDSISITINLTETSDVMKNGSCGSYNFIDQEKILLPGDLTEGFYADCSLNAKDEAGNEAAVQIIPTFTIDLTPPVSPSIILMNGAEETNMENITIEISSRDDLSRVEKYCLKEINDDAPI